MIISAPFQNSDPRLRVIGLVIGLGLLALLAALWNVQVLRAVHYGNRDQAQSLRRIRVPSARGDIVDRNGVVLANNRRSVDIVMYLEQLGHTSKQQDVTRLASETLATINEAVGAKVALGDRDVRIHYEQRRPLPLTVMRDVSTNTVAAFVERINDLPGVDLIVTPVRQYPYGSLAAHVLGYVGKPRGNLTMWSRNWSVFITTNRTRWVSKASSACATNFSTARPAVKRSASAPGAALWVSSVKKRRSAAIALC
jgi:penicillin-binding protein 2